MNAGRSERAEVWTNPSRDAVEFAGPSCGPSDPPAIAKSEIAGFEPRRSNPLAPTRWEHFPHEADVGIRGIGTTKAEAFAQAALALTAVVADPVTIRPMETVVVTCRAPNDELLLVDWLNALIYEMATRKMLFSEFAAEIEPGGLHGWACGERVDVARHRPAVEIKGATLAELRVGRGADGRWCAQCVVDV